MYLCIYIYVCHLRPVLLTKACAGFVDQKRHAGASVFGKGWTCVITCRTLCPPLSPQNTHGHASLFLDTFATCLIRVHPSHPHSSASWLIVSLRLTLF